MKYFTAEKWFTKNRYGEVRPRIVKVAINVFVWLAVLVTLLTQFPLGTIGAGERGVRLRFNAVTGDVLKEGLYVRIPFIERVITIDVKTQKLETDALAYSKDLQTVESKVALNYHLNADSVDSLYQEIGLSFEERIINPSIQEAVKAATAKFTAQELIDQRSIVKDEIKTQMLNRLQNRHIVIDDFSIINFDFSTAYEKAIEEKQIAQQTALAEKNKLETVKFQAEQRIAQSKAEAEAIRIQAEAITSQGGKEYVELKRIEKWNGSYPHTMLGDATPLININD